MELPPRIADMNEQQLCYLDALVDQVDAAYPASDREGDREERLAKDPHLAILPSGEVLCLGGVLHARPLTSAHLNRMQYGTIDGMFPVVGDLVLTFCDGGCVLLNEPHDIAAVRSALNDIGVYVAAPTLKGDDADGDGITHEGAPV